MERDSKDTSRVFDQIDLAKFSGKFDLEKVKKFLEEEFLHIDMLPLMFFQTAVETGLQVASLSNREIYPRFIQIVKEDPTISESYVDIKKRLNKNGVNKEVGQRVLAQKKRQIVGEEIFFNNFSFYCSVALSSEEGLEIRNKDLQTSAELSQKIITQFSPRN